jgi:acyl-coenzyme A thioesterase PaaI-like protein
MSAGVLLCGGCGPFGRCRFGVTAESLGDDGVARFELHCPDEYEGGPHTAHGGWTSAAMTELLGRQMKLQGLLSVVAAMSMSFDRPVPIGLPLRGESQILRREERKFHLSASLLLPSSGAVLSRATATAVLLKDAEHYERFERWLEAQETKPG